MQRLIAIRKAHPVLGSGQIELLECAAKSLLAFVRTGFGESVLAVHNLSGLEIPLDPAAIYPGRAYGPDLLSGAPAPAALAAYQSVWLPILGQAG
jgi:glycosidase